MTPRIHVAAYHLYHSNHPHAPQVSFPRSTCQRIMGPGTTSALIKFEHAPLCLYEPPRKEFRLYLPWASIINCKFSWRLIATPILYFLFSKQKKRARAASRHADLSFSFWKRVHFMGARSEVTWYIRECIRCRGRAKVSLWAAYLVGWWWTEGWIRDWLETVLWNGGAHPPHCLAWVQYVSRQVYG